MAGIIGFLTAKQRRALNALLNCRTITEAAFAANIGERTIRRWLDEDTAFIKAYQAATDHALDESIARLNKAVGGAVEVLAGILEDPDASRTTKINAARAVLEFAFKGRELALGKRLDELEELIKNGGQEVEYFETVNPAHEGTA